MANRIVTLMDTDWRVQVRAILTADTNASPGITFVDVSALQGWVAAAKLAITKVFWSLDTGVLILNWLGTGGGSAASQNAIVLSGNGSYGFSPGQPALLSDAVGTNAVTGDLNIVNASSINATIIVECNKHVNSSGEGWSG